MKPNVFGNETHNMLGHYSGPWAVRTKAKELGLTIPPGKEKDVLAGLRAKLKEIRREVTDDEFRTLVKAACG
jgi:hypothetical protein